VADLEDIVVHIFSPEMRNYYRLEQLWNKAKTILTLQ
jgi:ribosome-associated protein